MSDPIRHKKTRSIFIDATFNKHGDVNPMRLNLLVNDNQMKLLNEDHVKQFLNEELKKVSPNPVSAITCLQPSFKYDEADSLKDFDYGNILVEAHLPYCLHIPNDYEIEVSSPENIIKKVLIIPTKIWTNKGTSEEEKSDTADFFGEDFVAYYNKGVITGPKMPVRPEEGWQQNFTGRNSEKIKDQNGTFRYTRVYIQFDYSVSMKELDEGEKTKMILQEIEEVALNAVNRLIDCYRFVTKKEYIQRLGSLGVNMIYFIDHNHGFYISSPNIETAPINRTKKEINEIERMLNVGEKPPLYSLLLLDAQSSFDNKRYALAVVQSFQALEIFLEEVLIKELKAKGKTDQQCEDYLNKDRNWMTKNRLGDMIRELKGASLVESNKILWDKWCILNKETRNNIIHKGKEAKTDEVQETLETNSKVIEWLKSANIERN